MRDNRKRGRFAALLLALCLTGSTAACGLVDPCGESRNVDAMIEADSRATGAVDGLVSLLDSRDDGNDQFSWIVFFAPTNSADSLVTDVHLHERATDDILYTLPVSVERADPGNLSLFAWIVSSYETSSYQGSEPLDRLYGLVSSHRTYVDVHTVPHPTGAKGGVAVRQSTDWTQHCD